MCCSSQSVPEDMEDNKLINKSPHKKISMKNVQRKSNIQPSRSAVTISDHKSMQSYQPQWSQCAPKNHSRQFSSNTVFGHSEV